MVKWESTDAEASQEDVPKRTSGKATPEGYVMASSCVAWTDRKKTEPFA